MNKGGKEAEGGDTESERDDNVKNFLLTPLENFAHNPHRVKLVLPTGSSTFQQSSISFVIPIL